MTRIHHAEDVRELEIFRLTISHSQNQRSQTLRLFCPSRENELPIMGKNVLKR